LPDANPSWPRRIGEEFIHDMRNSLRFGWQAHLNCGRANAVNVVAPVVTRPVTVARTNR
jgi:hypothetical protein